MANPVYNYDSKEILRFNSNLNSWANKWEFNDFFSLNFAEVNPRDLYLVQTKSQTQSRPATQAHKADANTDSRFKPANTLPVTHQ